MTPSPSRGEIHRQLHAAGRDVRCFVAVSDMRLQALRETSPQAKAAIDAAFADAAVVVSLDQMGDVDAALEIVRQARVWLQHSAEAGDVALAGRLEDALADAAARLSAPRKAHG